MQLNSPQVQRYRQVNPLEPRHSGLDISSYRPTPFAERTDPQIPVVLRCNQVPARIEKVMDSGMRSDESLSLSYRLKSPHTSLSYPGRLVALLCPIVFILLGTVNNLGYQFPMGNTVTT